MELWQVTAQAMDSILGNSMPMSPTRRDVVRVRSVQDFVYEDFCCAIEAEYDYTYSPHVDERPVVTVTQLYLNAGGRDRHPIPLTFISGATLRQLEDMISMQVIEDADEHCRYLRDGT